MNQRQKIMLPVICIAMFGFLLVVLFGDNGLFELNRLQYTHQTLLKDNTQVTQENLQMYRSVDRLQNDPYYIENLARRELGMVRSDELIFKFKTMVDKP
jgi:cell division protein FtsB